ncbi:hypothetical protein Nos7107_3749 [Nostoc sp. PCC 7107]|nr:hypothetical protein Nos7107_3749 [Nostoc sp. PCC 7107]
MNSLISSLHLKNINFVVRSLQYSRSNLLANEYTKSCTSVTCGTYFFMLSLQAKNLALRVQHSKIFPESL